MRGRIGALAGVAMIAGCCGAGASSPKMATWISARYHGEPGDPEVLRRCKIYELPGVKLSNISDQTWRAGGNTIQRQGSAVYIETPSGQLLLLQCPDVFRENAVINRITALQDSLLITVDSQGEGFQVLVDPIHRMVVYVLPAD
jgi:hypothetical protein